MLTFASFLGKGEGGEGDMQCLACFSPHGKLVRKLTGTNSNKINTKQKLCQHRQAVHFIHYHVQ